MSKGFDDNKSRMVVEKKYTDTDLQEFAEWTSKKGWYYNLPAKEWCHEINEPKTTAQLLQDFKDWKEGKNE
jgi:hypothetical protein